MADLNETNGSKVDMTSYEFAHSGCSWCHPGGGPMEYDRDGYRYDGDVAGSGLGVSGINPAVTNTGGILTTSTRVTDYYIFKPDTGIGTIAEPSTVTNPGSGQPYKTWVQGGVAEADCLMCHYANQYANLERAYAFPGATMPKIAASLGLVGAKGQTGLLNITAKGSWDNTGGVGINPSVAPTGWSWGSNLDVTGSIVTTPNRENCAICHFPDKSWWGDCSLTPVPANCGPAKKPFGATMFQKYLAAGSTADGDIVAGGNNATAWMIAKGRVEGGKRSESMNDGNNPDAHMKTAGLGMSCVNCHYMLQGSFPALMSGTNEIQPAITVQAIDHQFAKGNNTPDGKNMDQLDNTVTCASCHITGTHPNTGTAPNPATAHAGFPAYHFDKIDCKTCHIPVLNATMKQFTADFSAGPFQTFERTDVLENKLGVNQKPLYMWRATEHNGTGVQIEPISTMTVPVWANATSVEAGTGKILTFGPTFQRLAKKSAEGLRAYYGDTTPADGIYDWPLNATNDGDKTLIINTQAEITDMITLQLIPNMTANGVTNPTPFLHFYFNQFAASHNVMPKTGKCIDRSNPANGTFTDPEDTCNYILGSAAGGGCVMCHSSSDPANPNYSSKSVGFFDKTHKLFNQPADGGGLKQVTINDASANPVKRVNVKFAYKKADGSAGTVDLSGVADGSNVGNTVNQGTVLGYDSARLAVLMSPSTGGEKAPTAKFKLMVSQTTDRRVDFDATPSVNANSYAWSFTGPGSCTPADGTTLTSAVLKCDFTVKGVYTATLTVANASGQLTNTLQKQVYAIEKNVAPTATIGSSVDVNTNIATITLTGGSSDIVKISIDWNDGKGTMENAPLTNTYTHQYGSEATYYASITLVDNLGLRTTYKVALTTK